MSRLDGKVAIATGAGRPRGIGFGIARRLAAAGATVVLTDLASGAAQLEECAARIRAQGGSALGVTCDVTSAADVEALFARVLAELGRVDVLVNNAGVIVPERRVSADGYELAFQVNHLAGSCWRSSRRRRASSTSARSASGPSTSTT